MLTYHKVTSISHSVIPKNNLLKKQPVHKYKNIN